MKDDIKATADEGTSVDENKVRAIVDEDQGEATKEISPFTNNLVLSLIFKKLHVCDLHRARCVSKLWNYISTNQLMKEDHIHLKTFNPLSIIDDYNYDLFGKFSKVFEDHEMFYSKFEIQDSALEENVLDRPEGVQISRFFELFSDKIIHLKIRVYKGKYTELNNSVLTSPIMFPNVEELEIIFSDNVFMKLKYGISAMTSLELNELKINENPSFPKLKKLTFADNVNFDLDRSFCIQLAQNAPNLVSFQMPRIPQTHFKKVYQHKFKKSIEPIFYLCRSLTHVNFYNMTVQTLSDLTAMIEEQGVRLKSFKAILEHQEQLSFKNFFDIVHDSLEDLYINYMGDSERVIINQTDASIQMAKLKSINVPLLFASSHLQLNKIYELYPELETLSINSRKDFSFKSKTECPKVTTLEFLCELPTAESLQQLEHLFPNLKKLTLRISSYNASQYLPLLWSMWSESLRNLTLYIGSMFDEDGFNPDPLSWNLDRSFAGDPQIDQLSIINLKKLRELHLFANSKEIILTDKTGIALLQLKELKLLKGSDGLLNFSKDIQDKLTFYNYDLNTNIACSSTNFSSLSLNQ